MTPLLALILLLFQGGGPSAQQQYLRYQRQLSTQQAGSACAPLDATIFPHAAPALKDLRLFAGSRELPYALTLSEAAQPLGETARVLNLGQQAGDIVFDLEMPDRAYTDVRLGLAGKDFLAVATVSGADDLHASQRTDLGQFTLFDLTTQKLSRSTTLALQETRFRFLHIVLHVTPAPAGGGFTPSPSMVDGAEVPPSREAQTVYTPVASTNILTRRGRQTVAMFHVPARVPIERVTLVPATAGNFSRTVAVTAKPDQQGSEGESVEGTVMRVMLKDIHTQVLSIPASLGANLQGDATVEVAIENGDDVPLQISSILLEMRLRTVCFEATGAAAQMMYGDPALFAPVYDYSRLFSPSDSAIPAQLGPETLNPAFQPRPDARPFTERHPTLLWLVLVAVIGLLGTVAIRSSRSIATPPARP